MSINRHHREPPLAGNLRHRRGSIHQVFAAKTARLLFFPTLAIAGLLIVGTPFDSPAKLAADEADNLYPTSSANGDNTAESDENRKIAEALLDRVLEYLVHGPPLEAKLRLRAWAGGRGREVVEVGHYEQAGRGTGRLRMELQVPIADGKARWQQTCDGRLAWTREELADEVRVRRVDLGRLTEMLPSSASERVPPRLRIGGLAEIIDRIGSDFELSFSEGYIETSSSDQEVDGVKMLVLKGTMRQTLIDHLTESSGGQFPDLVPRHVRIAIPREDLEQPLPSRIEFWTKSQGLMITLLEIYNKTEIEPPPIERFRFEAGGDDFTNETDFYLRRFSVRIANLDDANRQNR